MPLWGNVDDAANSTIYAASQVNLTPNTDNQTLLFGNITENVIINGITVGQFGFDTNEQQARDSGSGIPSPTHAGWILRTEGSGGRAGRVFYETLVAMGSMSGDAEDIIGVDYLITITSQPQDATGNSTNLDIVTFSVGATSVPSGGILEYSWQYTPNTDNTSVWATTNSVAGFEGQNTDTLSVNTAIITANGTLVRVMISEIGANDELSDEAELTVIS